MIRFYIFTFSVVVLLFCFSNISKGEDDDEEFFLNKTTKNNTLEVYDPFETTNRKIFTFNEFVYDRMIVPFGNWYEDKIPLNVRFVIKNIGENFSLLPRDFILSVLDVDIECLLVSFWRWATNSVFGLFGTDDVAYTVKLFSYQKSISNVLFFYHIPRGPYIMLPILGPYNLRDTVGFGFYSLLTSSFCLHYIFNIQNYSHIFAYANLTSLWSIPFKSNDALIWMSFGHNVMLYPHLISSSASTINFLSNSAINRYIVFRTAYYQSLAKSEQHYLQLRMNGNTKKYNVCDYDSMIELPEECNEDPKTYSTMLMK